MKPRYRLIMSANNSEWICWKLSATKRIFGIYPYSFNDEFMGTTAFL